MDSSLYTSRDDLIGFRRVVTLPSWRWWMRWRRLTKADRYDIGLRMWNYKLVAWTPDTDFYYSRETHLLLSIPALTPKGTS